MKFWKIFLITSVAWYLGISFIRWEIDWPKHLMNADSMDRLWFFLGLVGKTVIDYVIWSSSNKSKERTEDEQRKYHYDESGNDITNKTSIN